jgi:hypothetical protein
MLFAGSSAETEHPDSALRDRFTTLANVPEGSFGRAFADFSTAYHPSA